MYNDEELINLVAIQDGEKISYEKEVEALSYYITTTLLNPSRYYDNEWKLLIEKIRNAVIFGYIFGSPMDTYLEDVIWLNFTFEQWVNHNGVDYGMLLDGKVNGIKFHSAELLLPVDIIRILGKPEYWPNLKFIEFLVTEPPKIPKNYNLIVDLQECPFAERFLTSLQSNENLIIVFPFDNKESTVFGLDDELRKYCKKLQIYNHNTYVMQLQKLFLDTPQLLREDILKLKLSSSMISTNRVIIVDGSSDFNEQYQLKLSILYDEFRRMVSSDKHIEIMFIPKKQIKPSSYKITQFPCTIEFLNNYTNRPEIKEFYVNDYKLSKLALQPLNLSFRQPGNCRTITNCSEDSISGGHRKISGKRASDTSTSGKFSTKKVKSSW